MVSIHYGLKQEIISMHTKVCPIGKSPGTKKKVYRSNRLINCYIPNTLTPLVSLGYIMIGMTVNSAFYKYDNMILNSQVLLEFDSHMQLGFIRIKLKKP